MSGLIIIENGAALTTTQVIAEGVGNEHKAVIQICRKYIDDLSEFGRVTFEMAPFQTKGGSQEREIALLNEHQATLLLTYMRNTKVVREFKMKLVKAFFELASKSQPLIPQSLPEALRLAADAMEKNQALIVQVEELKPKADFHDKVVISEDAIPVSKAAKIIGTGRTRLFAFMRQMKWITRTNEPYQSKIESGHLDVKIGTWRHDERGLQETITTLITGKGLAALQKAYMERIGAS